MSLLLSHALRDELKEMYRSFGGDNRFRETHDIEQVNTCFDP